MRKRYFAAPILAAAFAAPLLLDEYQVPVLDPAVAARIAMYQELTVPIIVSWSGHTPCDSPPAGHDRGDSDICLPERVDRSSAVGIRAGISFNPGTRGALTRLLDRSAFFPATERCRNQTEQAVSRTAKAVGLDIARLDPL